MINLILKDIKLAQKMNIFIVIYALFIAGMGLSVSNYLAASLFYILGMNILIFVSVIYTNGYDDKYKTEIILNSLPIDRKNIVRGKYIALIIFIIVGCGVIVLWTNIISLLGIIEGGKSADIWSIIFVTNIVLLFYSIYYPIYFRMGEGIRSFNAIIWVLVMTGPGIVSKLMKVLEGTGYLEKIMSMDINTINMYFLPISVIIYYLSMRVSERIYMKRKF
ncbi:ABC-2 transporter permease [Schnuerera sp. xch1]|uniref:ABC-2 transporter permease n=1 Tax=Schnuerera sp. xch1 TaxID=2874283 RepID=UPI001CBFA08B|nr:ABC-2 transporter permease [Schnuerera sp. xch1]MBZ2175810.1 ABC-2 transporter permease [Schnuerera sp. xch1]